MLRRVDPYATPPSPNRPQRAPPRWRDEDIPAATSPAYWPAFFRAVAGQPPRDTLLKALDLFDAERSGHGAQPGDEPVALDVGCGEGRDALEMLRRGWRVHATDGHPEGIALLRARVPAAHASVLTTTVDRLESLSPQAASYDLVNASFSIPHVPPGVFPALWVRLVRALRPGGRFAGQFFGVRDEWNTQPDGLARTFHTRAEVESLLVNFGLDVEHMEEVERAGHDAFGRLRGWHVFHVVARKHDATA
jgi:SAM-dependent methyltransferase